MPRITKKKRAAWRKYPAEVGTPFCTILSEPLKILCVNEYVIGFVIRINTSVL
jgi:hypothetical protein